MSRGNCCIRITRSDEGQRFWVVLIEDGSMSDHLRSFLFDKDGLVYDEDAAYALAEVFAEGIVQGFRITSGLLPKDVEYLNR